MTVLTTAVVVAGGFAHACVPLRALITLQPQSNGAPGSQVNLSGMGFGDTSVEVRWNQTDGPLLGSANGPDFSTVVTVPHVADGLYQVVVVSRQPNAALGSSASAPFLVSAGGPITKSVSQRSASRGSNGSFLTSKLLLAIVAALLLLGGAILGARLTRRPGSGVISS